MNPSDITAQFCTALESRQIIPPQPIIADGQLHRCDAQGKHGKGDAAYLLHLDGLPAGGFENHRDGIGWENWRADADRTLDHDEQRAHQQRVKTMQAARTRDQQARHQQARQRATDLWDAAPPAPADHPYLVKKQVRPNDLRSHQGALVIPIRDAQGALRSLQFIAADGTKRFLSGGEKQGGFHRLGVVIGLVCIAEGYATAAAIHHATGHPVAVAFDAGNLEPVAKALRKAHPHARIVVCADDDHQTPGNPGQTRAAAAAKAVKGRVAIPEFGKTRPPWATDFNDLARLKGDLAVVLQVDTAADPDGETLEVIELADVEMEPIRWLWPHRFALGKISLVCGVPGLGKSQLLASLAAVVTTGGTWPVTREPFGAPADVLILSSEDDPADTLKPRLIAAGADLRRCRIVGHVRPAPRQNAAERRRVVNLQDDIAHLERLMKRYPATRLLAVDPLNGYLGDGRRCDSHKSSDVRNVLMPLGDLAAKYGVAVVGVLHLNKREGSSAMDRINGSGAFVALARAAWLVGPDPDLKDCRLFVAIKNNLAPPQDGLRFSIQGYTVDSPHGPVATSHLVWRDERVSLDADEVLSGRQSKDGQVSKLEEVCEWLFGFLANGPRRRKDIFEASNRNDFSEKTVYRAKEKLGITATKLKGKYEGWEWALPIKDGQDSQDGQDNPIENLTIFDDLK